MKYKGWFPLEADLRNLKEIRYIIAKHGPAGYGILILLMQKICESHNLMIHISPLDLKILTGDLNIDLISLDKIINTAVEVEVLSKRATLIQVDHYELCSPLLEGIIREDVIEAKIEAVKGVKERVDLLRSLKEEFKVLTTEEKETEKLLKKASVVIPEKPKRKPLISLEELIAPFRSDFGVAKVKDYLDYWTEEMPPIKNKQRWEYYNGFDAYQKLFKHKIREIPAHKRRRSKSKPKN